MNTLIQAIITGLMQGILEWLPVSSEGNLVIILTSLFGLQAEETLNTAIFLHIGTGLAALVYFRSEVLKIIFTEIEEHSNFRSKLFVITMLTGLVGFPIFRWLNISVIYGEMLLAITGIALILTGLLQRQASNQKQAGFELSWPLSIALGTAQGLSIIPGLSRSGLTTSILLFSDFTGEEAFRVSFLMSIPTSFAAAFGLMLVEGFRPDVMSALSTVVAATISYITIDTLLDLACRINLWKICVYIGTLAIIAWLPNLI